MTHTPDGLVWAALAIVFVGRPFWQLRTSTVITVTPPAGVICGPSCTLTLAEGDTGTLWLCSGDVVGM